MKKINFYYNFKQYLFANFKANTARIYFDRAMSYVCDKTSLNNLFSRSKSYLRQLRRSIDLYRAFSPFKDMIEISYKCLTFHAEKTYKIGSCIVTKVENGLILFYKGNIQSVFRNVKDCMVYAKLLNGKNKFSFLNIDRIQTGNYLIINNS